MPRYRELWQKLAISNDDFTDDEPGWKQEQKTSGPFALVQIGPTRQYDAVVARIRRELNGSVMTYN